MNIDKILLNPPERESNFKCDECGKDLFEGEEYHVLDGEVLCSRCAWDLFQDSRQYVTSEQENGI